MPLLHVEHQGQLEFVHMVRMTGVGAQLVRVLGGSLRPLPVIRERQLWSRQSIVNDPPTAETKQNPS